MPQCLAPAPPPRLPGTNWGTPLASLPSQRQQVAWACGAAPPGRRLSTSSNAVLSNTTSFLRNLHNGAEAGRSAAAVGRSAAAAGPASTLPRSASLRLPQRRAAAPRPAPADLPGGHGARQQAVFGGGARHDPPGQARLGDGGAVPAACRTPALRRRRPRLCQGGGSPGECWAGHATRAVHARQAGRWLG